MTIDKHKVVVLTYTLKVDGEIADMATEERPLDYIQGCHMLLPRFEDELEGKTAGDAFAFAIPAEDGYGKYDPTLAFDIPKSTFVVNGKLREDLLLVGRIVPMYNSEGQVCPALIKEVKEDSVAVDFNHPMAGKELNFTGKILSVREATEKELSEGLHGEFLPPQEHHCCHGKGGCHKHDGEGEGCCHGEGGCHGEGHGEGGCCGGGCHGDE